MCSRTTFGHFKDVVQRVPIQHKIFEICMLVNAVACYKFQAVLARYYSWYRLISVRPTHSTPPLPTQSHSLSVPAPPATHPAPRPPPTCRDDGLEAALLVDARPEDVSGARPAVAQRQKTQRHRHPRGHRRHEARARAAQTCRRAAGVRSGSPLTGVGREREGGRSQRLFPLAQVSEQ